MNFDAVSENAKILKIGPVEPKLQKIRQIVIGEIRRDTVLYNTVYLCNKSVEEVDNTSSIFISVFFTDIQE